MPLPPSLSVAVLMRDMVHTLPKASIEAWRFCPPPAFISSFFQHSFSIRGVAVKTPDAPRESQKYWCSSGLQLTAAPTCAWFRFILAPALTVASQMSVLKCTATRLPGVRLRVSPCDYLSWPLYFTSFPAMRWKAFLASRFAPFFQRSSPSHSGC